MGKRLSGFGLISVCVVISVNVIAQPHFFNDQTQLGPIKKNIYGKSFPKTFKTTLLNTAELKLFLWSLPSEQNLTNTHEAPVLSLPLPDGKIARFWVWESSIMEPALASKYPDIKTFAGQGIDDPYSTVRFDYNPTVGFSAQILSINGTIYIDPYSDGIRNFSISYYSKDYQANKNTECKLLKNDLPDILAKSQGRGFCRGSQLNTFRLAIACTGEYATAVCAPSMPSIPNTMASIITTINRVNGIYERELSVRFVLIANNDLLVYLDSTSDPYTNGNAQNMANENQAATDNIIGFNNYDIGQVFGTGNMSMSFLYSVCNSPNKAKSVSGLPNPTGDLYDVDRVSHNLGHMLGAIDTYNSNNAGCSGGPAIAGNEPGSGTTIMANAGTCGPDNLQPQNDPFFHASSIISITEFLNGPVAACKGVINSGNTTPRILSMTGNNSYIPVNTPFTLNAVAVDDDGDAVTYSWENTDRGPSGSWNIGATNLTSPLFKSRIPKNTGVRTFPDLEVILAGFPSNPPATQGGLKGEVLPQLSRTIKFALTIRDGRGGVVVDENDCSGILFPFEVYSVASAGPFRVILPNGGETWSSGSQQSIIWDVANTNNSPINSHRVNIRLSQDGGYTYPYLLASSVVNDGFQSVLIPSIATNNARIKIEAADNIFFDITNTDFNIVSAPIGFEFSTPEPILTTCPPGPTIQFQLQTISNGGFIDPIQLSIMGLPSGVSASFSSNPVVPGNPIQVSLSSTQNIMQGLYYLTVTGSSNNIIRNRTLVLKVLQGTPPIITQQPSDQTDCDGSNVTFSVVASGAESFQWQVSTDGGNTYSDISGATNSQIILNQVTIGQNNYYYRVVVVGQCGSVTSTAAKLAVWTAAFITIQPQDLTLCAGGQGTLKVVVFSSNPTYQWQVNKNDGNGFVHINAATGTEYLVSSVNTTMNNYQYRVLIWNPNCITPIISNVAILRVNENPAVTLTATPFLSLFPGLYTRLTANTSGLSPFTYKWFKNGSFINAISGTTFNAGVGDIGVYKVLATDINGCTGESNILQLSDSAQVKLFLWPNPNEGEFRLTYYSAVTGDYNVSIFNSHGQNVYSRKVRFSPSYEILDFKLQNLLGGTYFVRVVDTNGNHIQSISFLIL